MGLFRRRVTEKARQATNTGKDFEKTSKTRIAHTHDELQRFADSLRKYDKEATAHLKSTKDFSRNTKTFLAVQLPRMHQEVRPGESRALERKQTVGEGADMSTVGGGVDVEAITASLTKEREDEMFHNAQEPLRKWLLEFNAVSKEKSNLENMRLLQDSRRRSLAQIQGKIDKLGGKHSEDHPKMQKQVDAKHKQEVKLQQAQEEYDRKEQAVYEDMHKLVERAAPVRAHIVKLFDHLREANEAVVLAFPDSDTHRIGGSGSGDMRSPTGPPHAGVAASVVPPPAKAQSPEGAKPTQFGHGVVKQVGESKPATGGRVVA